MLREEGRDVAEDGGDGAGNVRCAARRHLEESRATGTFYARLFRGAHVCASTRLLLTPRKSHAYTPTLYR